LALGSDLSASGLPALVEVPLLRLGRRIAVDQGLRGIDQTGYLILSKIREVITHPADTHLSDHLATAALLEGCKSFCGCLHVRLRLLLLFEISEDPIAVLSNDLLTQRADNIK
jgi:hypothetical protein